MPTQGGAEPEAEAAPEEIRQAVGGGCQSGWGGYCRLQMPWKAALAVRETVTQDLQTSLPWERLNVKHCWRPRGRDAEGQKQRM